MVEQVNKHFDLDEQSEFDYYFMWEWPEHIETAMRRMLWISLVDAAEGRELREHTNYVRWLIATHPDSPPAVLDFLSHIDNEELLTRIAEHKQCSANTLALLSQSPYVAVRMAVAGNVNTPIHVTKMLTRDSSIDLRYSMAENPALPASLLNELCQDSNAYVAARAAKTMVKRNPASVQQLPLSPRRLKEDRRLG